MKRKLDAQQVLNDIKSGMDDHALMAKFKLSAKGLESLFQKMADAGVLDLAEFREQAKPPINAKDAVTDIRAGLDDAALMRKYRLTANGLQDLFRQLLDAGLVQPMELEQRTSLEESTVDVTAMIRKFGFDPDSLPRAPVDVPKKCPVCRSRLTVVLLDSPYECPYCSATIS